MHPHDRPYVPQHPVAGLVKACRNVNPEAVLVEPRPVSEDRPTSGFSFHGWRGEYPRPPDHHSHSEELNICTCTRQEYVVRQKLVHMISPPRTKFLVFGLAEKNEIHLFRCRVMKSRLIAFLATV